MSSLESQSDNEVGRELFARLFIRFETARKKDASIRVIDLWSFGFSLSRHGSRLMVNQGQQGRLIEIKLLSMHEPKNRDHQDQPWRATVRRSADRKRLALIPGSEGTLDEVIEEVVRTVLSITGLEK